MKFNVSSAPRWQSCQRRSAHHHLRRGSMMLWTVWVFLAMLMMVAGLFNVMWLSCVRSEARRHAESAVIIGGHAFLSDDLLRLTQQPFENEGRAARCRNAAIEYFSQSGDSSLSQIVSADDLELVQPLAQIPADGPGLSQPTTAMSGTANVPEEIRLIFGKAQPNDQVRMFFSGLTGVHLARLGVSAAAKIEHSPTGFLPGGNTTIPVLPFAIRDQGPAGESLSNGGGLWSREIEAGQGSDNLSWNPEQHSVENGSDGLPEITLTISSASSVGSPDSFVPLRFAAVASTKNSGQIISWMQNGVTAEDLKTMSLSQLSFPSTIPVSSLSNTECAEIAAWLQSHQGRTFIVCLCGSNIGAANSRNSSAKGSAQSTVQLNRPVAARIMASGIDSRGVVRVRLQPCVLITSTAVTSSSATAAQNRYLYSVRLCN